MSEKKLLILSPIEAEKGVEEAIQVTATCGHKCWLSPGSVKYFMDEEVTSKCVPCFGGNEAIEQAVLSGKGRSADPGELVKALREWLKKEHE